MQLWEAALLLALLVAGILTTLALARHTGKKRWMTPLVVASIVISLALSAYILLTFILTTAA